MFGKLQEAKKMAEEMKAKLDRITVESERQGVRVVANANKVITDIKINPNLLADNDAEKIEDLLMSAIADAMEQAAKVSEAEMKSMMSGILPGGLGNMFG